MVNHLDKHNLIRDSQHGFRQGYSCTTNLLTFLENVTAKINHRVDKVPHQRLIFKLKAHGVDGLVVNWLQLVIRQMAACLSAKICCICEHFCNIICDKRKTSDAWPILCMARDTVALFI